MALDVYFKCCILVLVGLLVFRVLLRPHRRRRLPPSPFAFPVIGHLHLIKSKPLHQAFEDLTTRHGPIVHLRLGYLPVVVVSSPAAVEECFTKNDIAFAHRPRSLIGDIMTYNYTSFVWAPYGSLWRILRRLTVIEVFSSNSLLKFSKIREEEVTGLVGQLYRISRDGLVKVEVKYLSSLLTFNVIMRIVVGRRLSEWENALMELGRREYSECKSRFLTRSVFNRCDFFPVLRWIGHGGLVETIVGMHEGRDEFARSLISEVSKNRIDGSRSNLKMNERPLLETLLSLQESDPEFYTDDVIKSLTLIMFVAGTETTTTTIEWTMSQLLMNPLAMEKAKTEINFQVGKEHLVCESDLAKLPYLRCVIYETLRLCPPVPLLLPHLTPEGCILGGYEIPAGTTLLVNAWGLHKDPKVWDEPDEFRPERFTGLEGERDGSRFIPFGMGRRACPGAAMGLRIVSLAVAALLQCFDWKAVDWNVDASGVSPFIFSKAAPLEAMCAPRSDLTQLLAKLQRST